MPARRGFEGMGTFATVDLDRDGVVDAARPVGATDFRDAYVDEGRWQLSPDATTLERKPPELGALAVRLGLAAVAVFSIAKLLRRRARR